MKAFSFPARRRSILPALCIVLSLLLGSCAKQEIVQGPGGLTVSIPPGALSESGEVIITKASMPPNSVAQDMILSGRPYEITAPGDGYFQGPVEIELPYDLFVLPDNRTEAEIFPVYFYEGTWYRMNGEVDKEKDVIRIYTLHNGIRDWAWNIIDNWAGADRQYFCERNDAETLQNAQADQERKAEVLRETLEDAKFKVEQIKDPTPGVVSLVKEKIKSDGMEVIINDLVQVSKEINFKLIFKGGGDYHVLIRGARVGVWLGRVGTAVSVAGVVDLSLILFRQAQAIGEVAAQIARISTAYREYKAAKALVWGLENGCYVATIPPDYEQPLRDYVSSMPVLSLFEPGVGGTATPASRKADECAALNLTPEECANAGEHDYSWNVEVFNTCHYGEETSGTMRVNFTFSSEGLLFFGQFFVKTGSNVYKYSFKVTAGTAVNLMVFSASGFTRTGYSAGDQLCFIYTYTLIR